MLQNVTFSLDPSLLVQARAKSLLEKKSLNTLVREWVAKYVYGSPKKNDYKKLMGRFKYANPGRSFSREEMNER